MKKVYIVFNTVTRKPAFITNNMESFQNIGFSLVKEIEIEGTEFNLARFKWDGDYDSGRLVDLFTEKKAIVTEQEIDMKYYGMFFRKYSVEESLFNLIKFADFRRTFEVIDGRECYTDNNTGGDMKRFLNKLLEKKEKEIEVYKTSPNHIFEDMKLQNDRVSESFKTK